MPRIEASKSIKDLSLHDLWASDRQIIVFFDQDHKIVKTGKPESGNSFNTVYPDIYNGFNYVWQADDYMINYYPNTCEISELQTKLKDNFQTNKNKFYVMQGILTPNTDFPTSKDIAYVNALSGKVPKNLEQLGNIISSKVVSWVNNDWYSQPLNIIMLEWICNSMVTQIVFMIDKYKVEH